MEWIKLISHKHFRVSSICLLALMISVNAGCRTCGGLFGIDDCSDIESGAIPEPAGKKNCDWQTAQVAKALLDQTTLYRSDFVDSSATLSPGAAMKINRAVHSGLEGQPWVVEPSEDERLDQLRVARVIEVLETWGVSDPVVQLNYPQAIGMPGAIAESMVGNARGGSNFNSFGNSSQSLGGFRR